MSHGQTILALDDNELTLRTYQRSFEPSGHRVLLSSTSDQAIDLARQHYPRLALVDVSLSMQDAKDGYSVCRELLAGDSPAPAVFLLTAYARSAHDRLRAFEAGAIAFYDKSVPPMLLVDDVNFFLKIPVPLRQLKGNAAASMRPFNAPSSLCPPLRVVVIDDSDDQIEAISMSLEAEGIVPFAARNARQGLLLAHRVVPDVIILDMALPDATGGDVLAALKVHSNTKDIPVIIWTGSERQGQELACMKEGAAQYLIKGVHDVVAMPLHVRACLREKPRSEGVLMCGPVTIETSSRRVAADGKKIEKLTSREFELLAYVVERSPAIVPWTEIERDVWRLPQILRTKTHAPKTIVVHLNELKKKMGRTARCLVTHRGHGLQFDPSQI